MKEILTDEKVAEIIQARYDSESRKPQTEEEKKRAEEVERRLEEKRRKMFPERYTEQ